MDVEGGGDAYPWSRAKDEHFSFVIVVDGGTESAGDLPGIDKPSPWALSSL